MTSNNTSSSVNPKALAWTIGVHGLLLLLFLFVHYSVPASVPVDEPGIEVNLGTSDEGSGSEQPLAMDDPAHEMAQDARTQERSEEDGSRNLLQSDEADAPEIRNAAVTAGNNRQFRPVNQDHRNHNTSNTIAANNQQPQQQRPRYVYNGGTGRGGNGATTDVPGSNEGNTNGKGDRGVPGGVPGASNYEGSPGTGTGGINHTLRGRSIFAPAMQADFREGGKVVVRVTVNRAGTIISREVVSSTNSELRSIALQKLAKVHFDKNDAAPEEQFGTITFVFKTRS